MLKPKFDCNVFLAVRFLVRLHGPRTEVPQYWDLPSNNNQYMYLQTGATCTW